ncbi:MAG: ArdC-like ssDNA-binding domain-containing protein [Rhizobiaceae bacterium]|nr:ArdC-like ssDNA-binding domain-containing protein [Rhizobiaceae bacterium]
MSRNQQKFDVHQEVTHRIVAALETAGEFQLPWIRNKGGSMKRPVNIASAKPYNGVNIVSLWVAAQACDYPSHLWGTYRQWQERGCQVRRGEKSSLIVFYKQLEYQQTNEQTGEAELAERMMARASFVFNAAQVDGFKLDDTSQPLPGEPTFDPIERAEAFAKATGAKIEEGGDMACYIPAVDMIRITGSYRNAEIGLTLIVIQDRSCASYGVSLLLCT